MTDPILTLVTPPAVTPVSLTEAKAHLRVDGTDEDAQITLLIGAATSHLDFERGILGRALMTQTWDVQVAGPDDDEIKLPISPVASVTSIQYYDENNALQTFDANKYRLVSYRGDFTPKIELVDGEDWPDVYDRPDAMTVRTVCGTDTIGDEYKLAVLFLVTHWFDAGRDMAAVGAEPYPIPYTFEHVIAPLRKVPEMVQ